MALKKIIEIESGVDGEYWRVTKSTTIFKTGKSQFVLCLYKDHAARIANKEPLKEKLYWADGAVCESRESIYTYLKSLPAFSGAEDV